MKISQIFEDIANGIGDQIFAVKPDIFVFITMILVAPVFEELIFRGIILDGLLKQYTPNKAIVISAILFMLPHGVGLLGVFLGGLFFGWIYYRSNNIILTMMAHASVNLCGFILRCIITSDDGAQYLVNQPKWGISHDLLINLMIITGLLVLLVSCVYVLNKQFKRDGKVGIF